ncbi:MAG: prenyltransferase [Acidimicrobiia bacterium]|nr:prenyltransferase [Acidimicrobiia bacterium]
MWYRLWAFIQLSRPHFLVGGFLMFGLGAATVSSIGAADYVWGQVLVSSTQLTAHYVNEYADVEPDRHVQHRTFFSGGSGVLAEEVLPARTALYAAWASTLVAVATAVSFVDRSPWVTAVGLVALGVSWAYSIPPIRLLDRGFGELITSAVVAGGVPLIAPLSQHMVTAELWWSIAILVPVHGSMILALELPDLDSDSIAGKRVLAVRLGRHCTEWLIVGLAASGIAIGVIGITAGDLPSTVTLAAVAVVPAAVMVMSMTTRRHDVLTASAVTTFVTAGAGLLVGLSI